MSQSNNKNPMPLGRKVLYAVILLLAPVVIYLGLVRNMRFFAVPSESMLPTLHPGDFLVTLSEAEYHRGDIVVLDDPENESGYIVKRIVGVGGDTVAILAGGLFIDEKYYHEPYIAEAMSYLMEPVEVPEGMVFILGDNRNESEDSSRWHFDAGAYAGMGGRIEAGARRCVSTNAIVGKVRYRYLPAKRAGEVASHRLGEDPPTPEPGTYAHYIAEGMYYFSRDISGLGVNWAKCAKAFEDARPLASNTQELVQTWVNEALAWTRAGNALRARYCLDEALKIDPDNKDLRTLIGPRR